MSPEVLPQWVSALAWLCWPLLFAALLMVGGLCAVTIEFLGAVVLGGIAAAVRWLIQ